MKTSWEEMSFSIVASTPADGAALTLGLKSSWLSASSVVAAEYSRGPARPPEGAREARWEAGQGARLRLQRREPHTANRHFVELTSTLQVDQGGASSSRQPETAGGNGALHSACCLLYRDTRQSWRSGESCYWRVSTCSLVRA